MPKSLVLHGLDCDIEVGRPVGRTPYAILSWDHGTTLRTSLRNVHAAQLQYDTFRGSPCISLRLRLGDPHRLTVWLCFERRYLDPLAELFRADPPSATTGTAPRGEAGSGTESSQPGGKFSRGGTADPRGGAAGPHPRGGAAGPDPRGGAGDPEPRGGAGDPEPRKGTGDPDTESGPGEDPRGTGADPRGGKGGRDGGAGGPDAEGRSRSGKRAGGVGSDVGGAGGGLDSRGGSGPSDPDVVEPWAWSGFGGEEDLDRSGPSRVRRRPSGPPPVPDLPPLVFDLPAAEDRDWTFFLPLDDTVRLLGDPPGSRGSQWT